MPQGAQVESFELIKAFRAAMFKFQQQGLAALGDADSELRRTLVWLETEQDAFWCDQMRKRHEILERAKDALRQKTLFKDASGRPPSAVEEREAVQLAKARLAEAEQKLSNTRRWARALQKEIETYKGSVTRLYTSLESLLPAGAAHLDKLLVDLEAYAAAGAEGATASFTAADQGTMSRGDSSQTPQPTIPKHLLPTLQQRQEAPAGGITFSLPSLAAAHQKSLILLAEAASPTAVNQRVILAANASGSPRLAFCRLPPADTGDSGWCVLALGDAPSEQWFSKDLASIKAARPDWANILALPTGFSVILSASGIEAVFNAIDQTVDLPGAVGWQAANGPESETKTEQAS
ncbi:MAG: hypothetical protein HKL96_04920 [Phycisphaerales bacterium]|nr:hypothetical protein [Phycisphaerales bacterium]